MTALTRPCPVNGCPTAVKPGKLMCRAHWAKVPAELQHEVYQAWNAYQAAVKRRAAGNELLTILRTYNAVRDQAVAAAYTADVET